MSANELPISEREKTDHALELDIAGIDAPADAAISIARAHAYDEVAKARAKTDELTAFSPERRSLRTIETERLVEDRVLQEERAGADDIRRMEHAQYVDILSVDREETDNDLLIERTRSDDVLATLDEVLGIVSTDLRSTLNEIVGSQRSSQKASRRRIMWTRCSRRPTAFSGPAPEWTT